MRHMKIGTVLLAMVMIAAVAAYASEKKGSAAKDPGKKGIKLEKMWELEGLETPESVIFDKERDVLYISNVAGVPNDKDGKGFISRVSLAGKMVEKEWVAGLNAPKGMAIFGDMLYVSDLDRLVAIDIEKGEVAKTYDAPDAVFLNDVTADKKGAVYVSDMMDNAIYRLKGDEWGVWLRDDALMSPNGLLAEKGRLVVACWGVRTEGFATSRPGHLKSVSYEEKKIKDLGDGSDVGALDGLEADGKGAYLVTDFKAGKLYRIMASGRVETLLELSAGSADLEHAHSEDLVVIPIMHENKAVAYRVE